MSSSKKWKSSVYAKQKLLIELLLFRSLCKIVSICFCWYISYRLNTCINVGLWYVFLYGYVDLSLVCFICCLDPEKSEKNQRAEKILVLDSLILYLNSVTHSVRRIPEPRSVIGADSDRVMFSGIGYEYTPYPP